MRRRQADDGFKPGPANPTRAPNGRLGHEVSDQTVGNVLRRHGIPPAPERKRRTTWAEFIRIHLALLAGTDISAAGVLMRGLVTCYVLFFIYLESSTHKLPQQALETTSDSKRAHTGTRYPTALLCSTGS